jgi:hypothetical protein
MNTANINKFINKEFLKEPTMPTCLLHRLMRMIIVILSYSKKEHTT